MVSRRRGPVAVGGFDRIDLKTLTCHLVVALPTNDANRAMTANTPGSRRGRATIEDVARAAGVSVATVSRALRGLPNVATSTRERVEQIAGEMAYHADPAATRLARGRAQSVAVAVPVLNAWYFANLVAGIEAVCTDAGYETVVLGISSAAQRAQFAHDQSSIHRRVDGVVLVDIALHDDDLRALLDHGLAIVTVGQQSTLCPSVGIDDVDVGYRATRHLIDLGHRRIGVVAGQAEDPMEFIVPVRREQGFRRACEEAGISVEPNLYVSGNFSISGSHEGVAALLDLPDPPTAIFAMSDEMAFGVIQAAHERGLDVPGDLSVIGVDDHDVAAVVELTTIRQDVAEHGARAARLVLEQLETGASSTERVDADVELIERRTTAPPRPTR
jgi:LacI family repressor for deo operon, udp, cdd, tsx, nupC, and nupG